MRTSTSIVSLVSPLVAAALALAPVHAAFAAPEEGDKAAEAAPEADAPADEAAPEGDAPADEATPEGETPAEGETPEGETPEGELDPEAAAAAEAEAAAAAEAEAAAAAEAEAAAAAEAEAAAAAEAEAAAAAEAEAEAAKTPEPSFIPDVDEDPEPRIANRPATGKGLMIAGGTVAGVGVAMTITFSLMTRNCSFDGPLQCRLQNQDDFLIPMSAATLITGSMVLAVGIGYNIRYKRWKRNSGDATTAFVPAPMRNGGGLAWVGRF